MNYPNGIKKEKTNHYTDYRNRGMSLENDLNATNEYYRNMDRAYIYKKPTPIKIVNVDYHSRKLATIREAYFAEPSTTDYNGIYKGKYIDFEAKETRCMTSFSLDNIHPHQITHLKNIHNNNGVAFLIVRFTNLDLTFLLMAEDFLNFIEQNERKSIPLSYFKEKGHLIKNKIQPRVDFLEIIDAINGGISWKRKI